MRLEKIWSIVGTIGLILALEAGAPPSMALAETEPGLDEGASPTTVSNKAWGRLEYFNWREYDKDTRRSEDQGPRISIGASRAYNQDDITFTPRVTAMAGYTEYDGVLGNPYNASISTYSKTFGFGIGGDVGAIYRLQGGAQIEPFAGLGWDWWRRDTASWGGPRETWDSIYARGGARASADLKAGQSTFRGYGELGLKYPLSTQNSVKYANAGKADLKPESALSAFAEAGVTLDRWNLGLAYDGWRFRSSDPVALGNGSSAVQRKTRTDSFSVVAGYSF
ncbi:MAG TPA: autotransporter outer membrane beta-barrel domain-containing protein [Candidatus Deferrimicrobiaceae bacterium]